MDELEYGYTEIDTQIDAALEAAKDAPPMPELLEVTYHRELDLLLLVVDDGRRLSIPRDDIWAVRNATPAQAADFKIVNLRSAVWSTEIDEGLRLENALVGRCGSHAWMDHIHRRTNVAA